MRSCFWLYQLGSTSMVICERSILRTVFSVSPLVLRWTATLWPCKPSWRTPSSQTWHSPTTEAYGGKAWPRYKYQPIMFTSRAGQGLLKTLTFLFRRPLPIWSTGWVKIGRPTAVARPPIPTPGFAPLPPIAPSWTRTGRTQKVSRSRPFSLGAGDRRGYPLCPRH